MTACQARADARRLAVDDVILSGLRVIVEVAPNDRAELEVNELEGDLREALREARTRVHRIARRNSAGEPKIGAGRRLRVADRALVGDALALEPALSFDRGDKLAPHEQQPPLRCAVQVHAQ